MTSDEKTPLSDNSNKSGSSSSSELDMSKYLTIKFDDPEYNKQFKYPSNIITTSKYTYLNFIPRNLFEQFRRIANWYFLLITILCFIEEIAPFSYITSILPLVLILSCTAAKDWVEDRK